MKKLIAVTALSALIAVGCASRDKNRGGASDTSNQGSGAQKWDDGSNKTGTNTNKSDFTPTPGTSGQPDTGRTDSTPNNNNSTPQ